jgi:hypothetical protein
MASTAAILNLVNYFVPRGLALYAYDLRDTQVAAARHIVHFDEYLADTNAFLKPCDSSIQAARCSCSVTAWAD